MKAEIAYHIRQIQYTDFVANLFPQSLRNTTKVVLL